VRTWKAALIGACAALLWRFGPQAAVGLMGAAAVVELGPARLRRLPRQVRGTSAAHLLGMLAASLACVAFSVGGSLAGSPERATLALLAAWLSIASALVTAAFHLVSFPLKIPTGRPGSARPTRIRGTVRRAGNPYGLPVPSHRHRRWTHRTVA